MAETSDEKLDRLQKELAIVQAELALTKAKQTQEASLAEAVLDAAKAKAASQFALEAEQAKAPLAELSGVTAAVSGMKLPAGNSGTVKVSAGAAGTAFLRSKEPMLRLLDEVAEELGSQLSEGAVIVTEAQLELAYQTAFTYKRIDSLNETFNKVIASTPSVSGKSVVLPTSLGGFAAATYSLGFVLDTVNSLAKLLRVDRQTDIFSADAEAQQMLGYMLEAKGPSFLANPGRINSELVANANGLLGKLDVLSGNIDKGEARLASKHDVNESDATLKSLIAQAKTVLEELHPGKKSESFWNHVKGDSIRKNVENRAHLFLEVKAQALQITKSRWYASDKISVGGEVQVAYRITDKDGKLRNAGIILKSSKTSDVSLDEMKAVSFPVAKSAAGK